jgi:FkbM family methyltransferase
LAIAIHLSLCTSLGLCDPSPSVRTSTPHSLSLLMGTPRIAGSVENCLQFDAREIEDSSDDGLARLAAASCANVLFLRSSDYRSQLFDLCGHLAPHLCRRDTDGGLGAVPALAGYVREMQRAFRGVDDGARLTLAGGPRREVQPKALQPAACVVRCHVPEGLFSEHSEEYTHDVHLTHSTWAITYGMGARGTLLGMPLVLVHVLRRLWRNDGLTLTVVDLGCNKGEFTHQIDELWNSASLRAFYAGVPPEVLEQAGVVPPDRFVSTLSLHCIEAIGTTVRELRKMQDRGFLTSAVRIHHLGISDGSAGNEAEFHSLGYGDTVGTLLNRTPLDGRPMVRETVRMTTLDDFAADHEVAHVNILKIDTEGNDGRVLLGASELLESRRIDVLIFEYGYLWVGLTDPAVFNLENAVEFLASFGYVSYLLTEWHAIRLDGECWRLEFENWPESADVLAVRDDFEHHCRLVQMLNATDS